LQRPIAVAGAWRAGREISRNAGDTRAQRAARRLGACSAVATCVCSLATVFVSFRYERQHRAAGSGLVSEGQCVASHRTQSSPSFVTRSPPAVAGGGSRRLAGGALVLRHPGTPFTFRVGSAFAAAEPASCPSRAAT
jgi:hypothetical protein